MKKIMDKQFKLTLSEQELNTVVAALNELPIKVGLQVLQNIIQQANNQNAPQEPVKAE